MKRRVVMVAVAGAVAVLAGGAVAAGAAVASTPPPTGVVHQVDVRDSQQPGDDTDRPGTCDGTPRPYDSASTYPYRHGQYLPGPHDGMMGEHHGVVDDDS